MFFDPMYLVYIAPALLLAFWAKSRMMAAYQEVHTIAAPLSGAAAARYILDAGGLHNVAIEQTPGELSDHYSPTEKVLRLSAQNFSERSLSAVGIAAHEAGHALQDAQQYWPMLFRNMAVPIANFGGSGGIMIMILGVMLSMKALIYVGIALFSGIVLFQLINLPVEYDASARAKRILVEQNIVPANEMPYVNKVLNAAALTYVAGTLESILTLLYYASMFLGGGRSSEE
jgi:Zn-dependent membrane protease YugP